ncbi:MAG TPA: response regulator [Bryobacteraceae bacterium]|jgi:CheY-like chemotaxis protein
MWQPEHTNQAYRRTAAGLLNSVLVVDDDEHFRELARGILEPAGFQVWEVESVKQCVSWLAAHTVDVVLLDILMPGRDGIEAVQEIKVMVPGAKIVTVSGARNSDLYLAVSAHLGADASLAKSKIMSLCALLDVLLDR